MRTTPESQSAHTRRNTSAQSEYQARYRASCGAEHRRAAPCGAIGLARSLQSSIFLSGYAEIEQHRDGKHQHKNQRHRRHKRPVWWIRTGKQSLKQVAEHIDLRSAQQVGNDELADSWDKHQ